MYKIWAFSEQELINYQTKIENATVKEIKAAESIYGNSPLSEILTINGDKAQIKIHGPLSQKGPSPIARFFKFGGTGYLQIINAINQISENEEIKKVELLMNTPGGEVLGVDNVFQAVKDLSEKKEVTAINQGMIASAGYWIASATGKIISESPVNLIGSVGVIITAVDTKQLEKKLGVRIVTVVSRNAPNKNPDVSKKSGLAEIQRVADSLERVFIARIAEGRKLPIDHIEKFYGRGSLLVSLDPDGTDAIDAKMIDEVITAKQDEEKEYSISEKIFSEIDNEDFAAYVKDYGNESINGIEAIEEINPEAPYANEHSARLLSPTIPKIRVRRTSGSGNGFVQGVKIPSSIDIIWFIQRIRDREQPRAQALRFPISTWTESEARSWLKKKKIKFILFEPAKKTKSNIDTNEICKTCIVISSAETMENFHKCIYENSDKFDPDSFRVKVRKNEEWPDGSGKFRTIHLLIAKPKGKSKPSDPTKLVEFRYPIKEWTVSEARAHCRHNKGKSFKKAKTPAGSAGINNKEVTMPIMTLEYLLAENPTAQAEYNQALEKKYQAGVDAGKQKIREDIKKISKFLTSSSYDEAVKTMSVKALNGEVSIDSVITFVSVEDMRKEKQASEQAKEETEKIGDTPGEQHQTGSGNGEIKTEADFQAEIARSKGGRNGNTE